MIITKKEKAFAGELKELMKKYGVRIEEDIIENHEEWTDVCDDSHEVTEITTNYRFSGPDIDVTVDEFELWRNISHDANHDVSSNNNLAA